MRYSNAYVNDYSGFLTHTDALPSAAPMKPDNLAAVLKDVEDIIMPGVCWLVDSAINHVLIQNENKVSLNFKLWSCRNCLQNQPHATSSIFRD